MSPEMLGRQPYTEKTDVCVSDIKFNFFKVFSFGLILCTVLAKDTKLDSMYPGCTLTDLPKKVRKDGARPSMKSFSPEAVKFLKL